jgi:hypothetical protein
VFDVNYTIFAVVPDEVELLNGMFSFCEMHGFLARRFDISDLAAFAPPHKIEPPWWRSPTQKCVLERLKYGKI